MARRKRRGTTVIQQETDFDCGVAALAMLYNKPYKDVWTAAEGIITRKFGVDQNGLKAIAFNLGNILKQIYKSNNYLDGKNHQRGILRIIQNTWYDHWVIWQCGSVIDPDGGKVWVLGDYLLHYNARTGHLFVED